MILSRMTIFAVFVLLSLSAVSALNPGSASFVSAQYTQPSFNTYYGGSVGTYWPILDNAGECQARQDVLLQIAPAGCQPAVVRSDLLAQQNVPVFCQIDALKINPVLDIKNIRNIRFTGSYPKEVSGTGFHPARAALATRNELLGDPLINNIGYIVVVLKRQANESALPESVHLNLQAQIDYLSGNVLGIGTSEFALHEQSDTDFFNGNYGQTFWNGKFKIRLMSADSAGNSASIGIYNGNNLIGTTRVVRGQTSSPIYLPGSYCQAALQAQFVGFESEQVKARIEVGDGNSYDSFEVYKGSTFLDGKCYVENIFINGGNSSALNTGYVNLRCPSGKITLSLDEHVEDSSLKDKSYSVDVMQNINDTFDAYGRVVKEYPFESDSENSKEIYGQDALKRAIQFAKDSGQQARMAQLIKLFIDTYPNSENAEAYRNQLKNIASFDYTKSTKTLDIDGKFRYISLASIIEPSKASSAQINYGSAYQTVSQGQEINLTKLGAEKELNGSLKIINFGANYIDIQTNCRDFLNRRTSTGNTGFATNRITVNEGAQVCGKLLTLTSTDVSRVARIKLVPMARNTETTTNLSVNIGIEKRAIKLNPEKTAERIKDINETIKKWENINKNLGNVVSGLKGACFATASVLTVKNFFAGLSGTALARQKVMPYWTDFCKKAVADGSYTTMDACFLAKSEDISKDVALEKKIIDNTNGVIKDIQKGTVTNSGVFGDSVNTKQSAQALATEIKKKYGTNIITVNGEQKTVNELLEQKAIDNEQISYGQLRDLYANLQAQETSGFSESVSSGMKKNLETSAGDIQKTVKSYADYENSQNALNSGLPPITPLGGTSGGTIANVVPWSSRAESSMMVVSTGTEFGKPDSSQCGYIANVRMDSQLSTRGSKLGSGETYLLCLSKQSDNAYRIERAFTTTVRTDGKTELNTEVNSLDARNTFGTILSVQGVNLHNQIKNPQVRFYETEPYKGMPAIVPFDVANGWYAGTKQTLPAFGGIGAFDSSGRVVSLWLCNVGDNGMIDFDSGNFGDDICQQFNLNTGQPVKFGGLSDAQAKDLVDKAVLAIRDASRQYNSGSKMISINGRDVPSGKPMSNQPETQCQDFMSPKECYLMFNVCDPVICPPTRCNFGGQFNVPDVVQSGIVGSALLCLPNIREGIFIPVCLSGVHAGVESYVSILKAHRDCLQENLKSGQMIGICDQIYSIYSCEFFWGQFAPLMKNLVPKIFQVFAGQGTRGGGEYLTTMAAWNNAQNSINYMTQVYGVNAFKAFQARNIDQAGTEICKAFISASVPTSLKSITAPDSPPQFTAYFSSTKYSDATVPATSQYNVFYTIFAGNDAGVSYRVYLRNPPESSYYVANPVVTVATGFIGKGQSATQTRDFTAPEGYHELCVNINGQEKCGFKQVSTSFAVNYIKDAVVSDELKNTNIQSEKECVSGSANAAALVNLNAQSAAQEAVNPDIYRRGIIRVCATQNPGLSTNPTRFVRVGNCGSENLGCWLDQQSVSNAISDNNIGVKNATLQELAKIQKDNLIKDGGVFDSVAASSALEEINGNLRALLKNGAITGTNVNSANALISRLNSLLNPAQPLLFWNRDKAHALNLLGQVQEGVTRGKLGLDKTADTVNTNEYVESQDLFYLDDSILGDSIMPLSFNDTSYNDYAFFNILNEKIIMDSYDLNDRTIANEKPLGTLINQSDGTRSISLNMENINYFLNNPSLLVSSKSESTKKTLILLKNLDGGYVSRIKENRKVGYKIYVKSNFVSNSINQNNLEGTSENEGNDDRNGEAIRFGYEGGLQTTVNKIKLPQGYDVSKIEISVNKNTPQRLLSYPRNILIYSNGWVIDKSLADDFNIDDFYNSLKGKSFEDGINTIRVFTENLPSYRINYTDYLYYEIYIEGNNSNIIYFFNYYNQSGNPYFTGDTSFVARNFFEVDKINGKIDLAYYFAYKDGSWKWNLGGTNEDGYWIYGGVLPDEYFDKIYNAIKDTSYEDGTVLLFSLTDPVLFDKLVAQKSSSTSLTDYNWQVLGGSAKEIYITGSYNPSEKQYILGVVSTKIYLSNNRVYLERDILGVDFVISDTRLGSVSNNKIKLLASAKQAIGNDDTFNSLDGANIGSYNFDSQKTKISK